MKEKLTDNSIMPFGKYQGNKMSKIKGGYLIYLYNGWMPTLKKFTEDVQRVHDYVKENFDKLKALKDEEDKAYEEQKNKALNKKK